MQVVNVQKDHRPYVQIELEQGSIKLSLKPLYEMSRGQAEAENRLLVYDDWQYFAKATSAKFGDRPATFQSKTP